MTSAYEKLTPARRMFVDAVIAGEIPTQIVRSMRPHLLRPDNLAWAWMRRADVQAALSETRKVMARLAQLEQQLARLNAWRAASGGTLQ